MTAVLGTVLQYAHWAAALRRSSSMESLTGQALCGDMLSTMSLLASLVVGHAVPCCLACHGRRQAIGFAVDYSAHIAEGFSEQDPSLPAPQRAKQALQDLGVSVLNGGLSTLIACQREATKRSCVRPMSRAVSTKSAGLRVATWTACGRVHVPFVHVKSSAHRFASLSLSSNLARRP